MKASTKTLWPLLFGIGEGEAAEVIDYLENHEEVVRYPQGDTAPSRFLLKPGRNWPPNAASAS